MTRPAPAPAAGPMETDERRIAQLLALTLRVAEAIAQDIAALEQGRFDRLRSADEDVARLCAIYGREVAALKQTGLAVARTPRVAQLRRAAAQLNVLLARHQALVAAMRKASEGLVQAVAKEIQKRSDAAAPYRPIAAPRRTNTPAIVCNKMV
jgi:hypothetical protein